MSTDAAKPTDEYAFPALYSGGREGMTLRDWFAGKALAHLSQPLLAAIHDTGVPPTRDEVAVLCGQIADAMMEEREKNG